MAALASVATLVAAGASAAGSLRQADAQRQNQRAQAGLAQQQEQSRQQELVVQREKDRLEREQTLARTIASTRARLGAAGVAPDDGSAAEAEDASDEAFRIRLARGRSSLLSPDGGGVTTALSVGRTLGQAARSLLG